MIAIDGPSGAGKSTAGRALAERMGYVFIDTGAMYRALALQALRQGVPLDREEELVALARRTRIDLVEGGRGVLLDGFGVTAEIRTQEVSAAASRLSAHPGVRREMVTRQRDMGALGGVVLDGRDIGTAVFPDAELKFYLDADPGRRAARRQEELRANGTETDVASIEREIRARDHADSTRSDSPLTRTPDALYLDTTSLSPEAVVEHMLAAAREKVAGPPRQVLVVDDEKDVQDFVRLILEGAGYVVGSAGNGKEALEAIEANPPDLVVLDLMMPVMDGWGLLERLRRIPSPPAVVIVSAFPDEWRALRAGAWECLAKPFDRAHLLETCARALKSTARR